MQVCDAIAAAIEAEGCEVLFGLLGDANKLFWNAVHTRGRLRIVSARHEATADGFARSRAQVGLASVTSGPGLTQLGTSLVVAARNRTPLVVMVGDVPANDLNNLQRFDHARFAAACESERVHVTSAGNVAQEVRSAFALARQQRRPVILNVSTAVQQQSLDWAFEYTPSAQDALARGAAPDDLVHQAAAALLAAQRPVLIAGNGAMRADARHACIALADATGSLLATSLKAKGLFSDQPWDLGIAGAYASAPAEELLAQADFVLGMGAKLGDYPTEGGLLFPEAQVARIDNDPHLRVTGALGGLYLCGDARITCEQLLAAVRRLTGSTPPEGFRDAGTAAVLAQPPAPQIASDSGVVPRALAARLPALLPPNEVVTLGSAHFWGFFIMHASVRPGTEVQMSNQFAAIGQTLPLAAGVGVARPGRPHLVIEGDGSIMMNIQELESLVRERIPAVVLVWNDCGFGAEVHKLTAKKLDPTLGRWPSSPDFAAIARAFSGDGETVTHLAELDSAMSRAWRACEAGRVVLLDVRVDPAAVSDDYQKIHFGVPNRSPLLRTAA